MKRQDSQSQHQQQFPGQGGQYRYQQQDSQQQDIPFKRLCDELIEMGLDMGNDMGPVTNYKNCEELITRYNASGRPPIPVQASSQMKFEYIGRLADFTNPLN